MHIAPPPGKFPPCWVKFNATNRSLIALPLRHHGGSLLGHQRSAIGSRIVGGQTLSQLAPRLLSVCRRCHRTCHIWQPLSVGEISWFSACGNNSNLNIRSGKSLLHYWDVFNECKLQLDRYSEICWYCKRRIS